MSDTVQDRGAARTRAAGGSASSKVESGLDMSNLKLPAMRRGQDVVQVGVALNWLPMPAAFLCHAAQSFRCDGATRDAALAGVESRCGRSVESQSAERRHFAHKNQTIRQQKQYAGKCFERSNVPSSLALHYV